MKGERPSARTNDELLDEVIERLSNGIGIGHTESFVIGCKHCIEVVRHIQQEYRNEHASIAAKEG